MLPMDSRVVIRCIGTMAAWALLLIATPLFAQSAGLRVEAEPHYANVPVTLEISLRGFSPEPEPECKVTEPEGTSLINYGIRSSGQSMSIINGRRTVEYQLTMGYEFVASKPGRYRVGPFTIRQGNTVVKTRKLSLEIRSVPMTDDMKVKVVMPEKPIFVGQRVPIAVEWWVKNSAFDGYLKDPTCDFSIPLFMEPTGFRFIDVERHRGENALPFATHEGSATLKIEVEKVTVDRELYWKLTAHRTLIPTKVGGYEFEAATATADKIIGYERVSDGLFSRRRARTEKYQTRDLPRTLTVKSLPTSGRPASFGGAVGRGYSIDVSADRTVVNVNDPITLTVTLRGEGLDTAGLAPLNRSGLDGRQFRASSGTPAGIMNEDGSKTFTVKIRAMDESLDAIPAIQYSWFDTDTGKYQTTESRPIALSVKRGQMVTAQDAVGQARTEAAADAEDPNDRDGKRPVRGQPTFTLTGADLSLSSPALALQAQGRLVASPGLRWLLYGAPFAFLGLALIARRRANVDPRVAETRKRVRDARKAIDAARSQDARSAAQAIADALRTMVSEVPTARSPELEAFVADLEVTIFRPDASTGALDSDVYQKAVDLADGVREQVP